MSPTQTLGHMCRRARFGLGRSFGFTNARYFVLVSPGRLLDRTATFFFFFWETLVLYCTGTTRFSSVRSAQQARALRSSSPPAAAFGFWSMGPGLLGSSPPALEKTMWRSPDRWLGDRDGVVDTLPDLRAVIAAGSCRIRATLQRKMTRRAPELGEVVEAGTRELDRDQCWRRRRQPRRSRGWRRRRQPRRSRGWRRRRVAMARWWVACGWSWVNHLCCLGRGGPLL